MHDVTTALRALDEAAALFRLEGAGHFMVTGRHRARFVHNMTTCDIKGLEVGQGNFGLFVEGRGRLVAQFHVEAHQDGLLVETRQGAIDAVIAQLTRFRVADDVHFAASPGWAVLSVVGPDSARYATDDMPLYGWRETELAGTPAVVRKTNARLARPAVDIRVAAEHVDAITASLVADGVALGCGEAFDVARVDACWPKDGVDLGLDNVVLESQRLYDTVDWDKGCYIGQEVIAMMHYRGRPNKHLRRLLLPAGDIALGTSLQAGDRVVGRLTSAVTDPRDGRHLGLAVIKRKFADQGTTLRVGERGEATVI